MKIASKGSDNDPAPWTNFNAENSVSFKSILHLPRKSPQDFVNEEDQSKNEMSLYEKKGNIVREQADSNCQGTNLHVQC